MHMSGGWQTDGATPLFIGSQNGHVEVVRALVRAGAAVNQARVRDGWGWWGVVVGHGVGRPWMVLLWDCSVRVCVFVDRGWLWGRFY